MRSTREKHAEKIYQLPIDKIRVLEKGWPVNLAKLQTLADSIRRLGLLQPIMVTTSRRLVFGRHRLAACKWLGWKEIPAVVVELDDVQAELAAIEENLLRRELTETEAFDHLCRREEILGERGTVRSSAHVSPHTAMS